MRLPKVRIEHAEDFDTMLDIGAQLRREAKQGEVAQQQEALRRKAKEGQSGGDDEG